MSIMIKINDAFDKLSKYIEKSQFKGNLKARLTLYKVLISAIKNKDTIKKAINKRQNKLIKRHNKTNPIYRKIKKPGGVEMPFLNHVDQQLLNGKNFSKSTEGWVSHNEQMLLESGANSDITKTLEMTMNMLESIQLMKKTLMTTLSYPIVLLFVLFGMIFAFSFQIIPILVKLLPPENWEASQKVLYDFCMFFSNNFLIVVIGMILCSVTVIKTLPILTGKIRSYLDIFPPWSIYKEFNAGIFLISLSTLMQAGNTPIQSLHKLRASSPKYVREELDKMIIALNDAVSPATAINTGFLGEIGDDIEDISENGAFDDVLVSYGKEAIEQIIENIKSKTGIIRNILMVLVVVFIGWGYSTFITIAQSISSQAGGAF